MLLPRRRWNCGEADWLIANGHDPKQLLGYPMHLTERQVTGMHAFGVTANEAMNANVDHSLDDNATAAEWGPLGYEL